MKIQAFLACAALCLSVSAGAQQLTRHPYPQNMRTDSVDVLWRTDVPAETWIRLNEKGSDNSISYHSTVPTTKHEIHVPGLKPDTVYEYRVAASADDSPTTGPFEFQTFPTTMPQRVEFMAYGDHRNNPKDHRAVVEAVLAMAKQRTWPRFVVDTGDFTGLGEHPTDFWNEQFFEPCRGLIENTTYFPTIGNHEADRRHPRIPFRYLDNFSVPTDRSGTEYYYSFTFGDIYFLVLDVYATDFATDSKQWQWAKRDLAASKAKWKFVSTHYPVFIHRTGPSVSYGNMEIREHLVPLFERYGVTAVFSGDSHFYQRSEVNGIHYICTGGAGAPLYDPGAGQDYIRASAKVNHYTWVAVEGDKMELYAYDRDNNLIDSMTSGFRTEIKPPEPAMNFERKLPDASMKAGETVTVEARDAAGKTTAAPAFEQTALVASTAKSKAAGLAGQGSLFSDNVAGDARFTVRPALSAAGKWLVSVTVPVNASISAPATVFEVATPGKELVRGRVDLSPNVAGDLWYDIGLLDLAPGSAITFIEAEGEPGRFYADGVKFTRYE